MATTQPFRLLDFDFSVEVEGSDALVNELLEPLRADTRQWVGPEVQPEAADVCGWSHHGARRAHDGPERHDEQPTAWG